MTFDCVGVGHPHEAAVISKEEALGHEALGAGGIFDSACRRLVLTNVLRRIEDLWDAVGDLSKTLLPAIIGRDADAGAESARNPHQFAQDLLGPICEVRVDFRPLPVHELFVAQLRWSLLSLANGELGQINYQLIFKNCASLLKKHDVRQDVGASQSLERTGGQAHDGQDVRLLQH